MPRKNKAAVALGRKGGAVSSDAKAAAARLNGAKGGRPRADGSKPAEQWRGSPLHVALWRAIDAYACTPVLSPAAVAAAAEIDRIVDLIRAGPKRR